MTKGYFNLPWGQVHYRHVPSKPDLPVLLLLHQSPLSSETFERLLPHLAGWCRPYALDTPSYGGSSAAPEHWKIKDYGELVWQCADQLGASEILLFGRATGTVFALQAALSRPERVRRMALYGLPVYSEADRAQRLAPSYAPRMPPRSDGSHLTAIWQRILREYPWMKDDPELAAVCARGYFAAGPDFAQPYRVIWREPLPAGRLPVPTLLIGGTRDRIGFMYERAVARYPEAQAVLLEGATDYVAWQEPARLAQVLKEFYTR